MERECPANAHVARSARAGSVTALQYTSGCVSRYWNSTTHRASASTIRIMSAIPASVTVAASIAPNDAQGPLPLTSEAMTRSCPKASAAVVNSDQLSIRRNSG
jgi:hypothetical protein